MNIPTRQRMQRLCAERLWTLCRIPGQGHHTLPRIF